MLGICAFLLMVISLSFRESNAIFTDLSFFSVITAGLTKQISSMLLAFSIWPCFMFVYSFPDRLLQVDRYWSSFLLYQFCVFFLLYFYLDFNYGVIFVEQFFESFLQDGCIRILGYMVYLWVNLVGIKCYSQFLHPVQA